MLSGKSNVIGALVPSVNVVFFMDFLQAIKEACDANGLRLFISPVANAAEFLDVLGEFAARRVGGIIAVPPEEGITVPATTEHAVRIATLLSPVANAGVPLFAPDERRTAEIAVEYLTKLGHRRIVHVTYRRDAHAICERREGYVAAMIARGLEPRVVVYEDAAQFATAVDGATALFCHNDAIALKARRALHERGVDVPGDVSVLGVDHSATFNQFDDTITALAYPVGEIASKAVRWLLDGVDERPILEMRVIEKRSVQAV